MPAQLRAPLYLVFREPWCLVVAACLLAGALLWEPIVHVRTHTLGPWDWVASSTDYLRPDPPPVRANHLLTDPVRQTLPWALLAREEIAHGRLPLWNNRNGTGVPLLANYQSALLSPFTWPYYVLGLKLGTLVSAFARLVCAACGSYLFLRSCAFAPIASGFGATVYTASSGQLLRMLDPHSAVTALCPLVLLCVERLIQAGARADYRSLARASAALAVAGGLSGLAGHPEMVLASALLAGVYALARIAASRPPRLAPTLIGLLAAGTVAAAISAPQVLPFAEYFRESFVIAHPSGFLTIFDPRYLTLLFFPHLVGTPVGNVVFATGIVSPNYQEQTTYYLGALPLLCMIGAGLLGVLRTRFAIFAGLALLVAVTVWNVGGLGERLGPFLSLGLIPAGRFYSIWTCAATVLAAWLVQRLISGERRVRAALVLGACAVALYAGARWGVEQFVSTYSAERGLDPIAWKTFAARHLAWIGRSYWVGALALMVLGFARSTRVRWSAAGILCAAQLAATAGVVGNYVPITRDELVLPETPNLQALRAIVGDERVLFFDLDEIPTDTNAALGVRSMMHYDAIWIRDVEAMATSFFRAPTYEARVHKATANGLRLFGVRYVSTHSDWLPIDTLSTAQPTGEYALTPYLRLVRTYDAPKVPDIHVDSAGVRQIFTVPRDGLSGLVVHFRPRVEADSTPLAIALYSSGGGLIAQRELQSRDLDWIEATRQECVLTFPPVTDSAGQSFVVEVRALVADAAPPRLRGVPGAWIKLLGLERPDPPTPAFVVDLMFGESFIDRGDIGGHSLFELADSQGRAWIVSGVLAVEDPTGALAAVTAGDFEPYERVVLSDGFRSREPDAGLVATLATLHEDPQALRWHARVDRDALLVVAQPHYPGWVARLDGEKVPLLRANYAFCAVELPPGEHEVQLAYEPRSVRLGLLLGAVGCLTVATAWLKTRISRASASFQDT